MEIQWVLLSGWLVDSMSIGMACKFGGLNVVANRNLRSKVSWDNFHLLKRQVLRIKITLKTANCHELLSEIGVANKDLQNLVDQNLGLEPKRSQMRLRGNAAASRLIRQHARSLHAALLQDSSWKCRRSPCRRQHRVSLRLEPWPWCDCKQMPSSHGMTDIRFVVLLSTETDQEEVRDLTGGRRFEVRPVEEPRIDILPREPSHPMYVSCNE